MVAQLSADNATRGVPRGLIWPRNLPSRSLWDRTDIEYRIAPIENINQLEQKRDELQSKASQIQHSGEQAWQDIKTGADMAWKIMEEALDSAKSRFK